MIALELVDFLKLVGDSCDEQDGEDSSGIGVKVVSPHSEFATSRSVESVVFAATTTHVYFI